MAQDSSAEVRGRLVGDGRGVPGINLAFQEENPDVFGSCTSDEGGRFSVLLPSGQWYATGEDPHHRWASFVPFNIFADQFVALDPGTVLELGDVCLAPRPGISGSVLLDGLPCSGIRVHATGPNGHEYETFTDEEGRFALKALHWTGRHTLRFGAEARRSYDPAPNYRLGEPAPVYVTEAPSGELVPALNGYPGIVASGEVRDLPPVSLTRAGAVGGRLLDSASQRGIQGVHVYAVTPRQQRRRGIQEPFLDDWPQQYEPDIERAVHEYLRLADDLDPTPAVTDAYGAFEIHLPSGPWQLVAQDPLTGAPGVWVTPGTGTTTPTTLAVEAGVRLDIGDVTLPTTGRLHGYLASDEFNVAGAVVFAFLDGQIINAAEAPQGEFSLGGLPSGDYALLVVDERGPSPRWAPLWVGGNARGGTLHVAVGQTTEVGRTELRYGGGIVLDLALPGPQPHGLVILEARLLDGSATITREVAAARQVGPVTFTGLRPGMYELAVQHNRGAWRPVRIGRFAVESGSALSLGTVLLQPLTQHQDAV